MKVIIAGSRTFHDFTMLTKHCNIFNNDYGPITEVVSGTARGADTLGEQWAKDHNIKITRFPADWNKFGRSAGYKRNVEMADYADALIAFDMGSRGIGHMINIAKERKLKIYRVKIKTVGESIPHTPSISAPENGAEKLPGTLTKYGWAFKCNNCNRVLFIPSDNIIPTCECGGEITTPSNEELKKEIAELRHK